MRTRALVLASALSVLLAPQATGAGLPFLFASHGARLVHQGLVVKTQHRGVILQTHQVHCGPAAVASLMTLYFNDLTTEEEIAEKLQTAQKGGASLRDLREAFAEKGYEAVGYRLSLVQLLDEIEHAEIPVLVHLKSVSSLADTDTDSLHAGHYVFGLGEVASDFLLISDPARGDVLLHKHDFLARWTSYALVVSPPADANRPLMESLRASAEKRLHTLKTAFVPRARGVIP